MEKKNIIDVCVGILPKSLQNIYYKYEEKWLYVLFGGLTTLVSMITKLVPFMLIRNALLGKYRRSNFLVDMRRNVCVFHKQKICIQERNARKSGISKSLYFVLRVKTCNSPHGMADLHYLLQFYGNKRKNYNIDKPICYFYSKLCPQQAFCIQKKRFHGIFRGEIKWRKLSAYAE